MQKIAVLSDIHGNPWALERVLQDIWNQKITEIVNLGDLFYGPLDPKGTAALLQEFPLITIQGNQDRLLHTSPDPHHTRHATLNYTLDQLPPDQLSWLRSLPKTRIIAHEILLCHGTPADDQDYLLEDVSLGVAALRSGLQLQKILKRVPQSVILCGHSHLPGAAQTPDGKLIVNPGSVGLPAYTDDTPGVHKMESGSPHASYALLIRMETGWGVEHRRIPYDWEKAAGVALKNQRPDWAQWLRSGRA